MRQLRETFTDQEFSQLEEAKTRLGLNWHDTLLWLSKPPILCELYLCAHCGFHTVDEALMLKHQKIKHKSKTKEAPKKDE